MHTSKFTKHAIVRMSQRGFRFDDLELAEFIGTEVEGGWLVRRKDVQAALREIKRVESQIRRLDGTRFVWAGEALVTVYHATGAKTRRLLRGSRHAA